MSVEGGSDLFTKITIGNDQVLKNRIVMAPMTRARCDPNTTQPNDIMKDYYTQRASSGLIITEGTEFSEESYGWMNSPMITEDHVDNWKKIVDSVHDKDGMIYVQLWHLGRQAHSSMHPTTNDIVSASAIAVSTGHAKTKDGAQAEWEIPRALSIPQIKVTIQDYVKAAQASKKAGFDGIEVHGANGYLIDQFLQSKTNVRTDEYGGSMENRIRILLEIIDAIIAADNSYPANRIGVRLSPNGIFGDMGSDDNDVMFPFVAQQLSKYGLAYLHVMDGLGFGYHGKCPVVTAYDMKKNFNGPLIANVGLTKEVAEGMLRSGAVDMVCFGRPYISNPDLPERFKNGWPLNPESQYPDWWTTTLGSKGYSDFPLYNTNNKEEGQEEKE